MVRKEGHGFGFIMPDFRGENLAVDSRSYLVVVTARLHLSIGAGDAVENAGKVMLHPLKLERDYQPQSPSLSERNP